MQLLYEKALPAKLGIRNGTASLFVEAPLK